MANGRLLYVVGPSGAGKDSVLAFVRTLLQPGDRLLVAHRYITRPAGDGNENHLALSRAEFDQRQRAGCFALHWQSHGLSYGIGREIELWMSLGFSVLVNGSREYAPQVAAAWPSADIVEITVDEATLRQRLLARGRESTTAIDARLARNRQFADQRVALRIVNDQSIAHAAHELLDWSRRTVQSAVGRSV